MVGIRAPTVLTFLLWQKTEEISVINVHRVGSNVLGDGRVEGGLVHVGFLWLVAVVAFNLNDL